MTMHPGTVEVNRHVNYYGTGGKIRSATITAVVTSPTTVNLRVGRHGETYLSVVRRVAATDVGVWDRS